MPLMDRRTVLCGAMLPISGAVSETASAETAAADAQKAYDAPAETPTDVTKTLARYLVTAGYDELRQNVRKPVLDKNRGMKQLSRRRPNPGGFVWQAVPLVIAREDAGGRCSDSEFVEIGRHLPRPLRVDEWAGLGAGHSACQFFALPARLAYRSLSEKSPLEESLRMQVRYGRVSGGPCPRR